MTARRVKSVKSVRTDEEGEREVTRARRVRRARRVKKVKKTTTATNTFWIEYWGGGTKDIRRFQWTCAFTTRQRGCDMSHDQ